MSSALAVASYVASSGCRCYLLDVRVVIRTPTEPVCRTDYYASSGTPVSTCGFRRNSETDFCSGREGFLYRLGTFKCIHRHNEDSPPKMARQNPLGLMLIEHLTFAGFEFDGVLVLQSYKFLAGKPLFISLIGLKHIEASQC